MTATVPQIQGASASTQELYEKACAVREKSYSPYSRHKVGAALKTAQGKIFTGCNVENSSYGGTICAERTAVLKAVSETGPGMRIQEIVVVTDASPAWPPCGMCRQVLAEFAHPLTSVHAVNLSGQILSATLEELLPRAFTPAHLLPSDQLQG